DPLGQLRKWTSALFEYVPRELPLHAVISETVFERMTSATPLYAPASLFNLHDQLHKRRDSVSSAVNRLKDTNSLSPEEHDAILAFKERLHLTRWPQYLDQLNRLPMPPPKPETRLANEAHTDMSV
ncbi:MAG: hypothetical protein ACR2OX_00470, partial [Methyloligellaceae bacterium]